MRVTNRADFDEIDVTPQQRFRLCQQTQIGVAPIGERHLFELDEQVDVTLPIVEIVPCR